MMQVVSVKRTYQAPVLRQLSLPQVKAVLLNQAEAFLDMIFSDRRNRKASHLVRARKQYEKPALRQLTPEQAKLLLIGHASVGNKGATEIAGLLFADSSGSIEPTM